MRTSRQAALLFIAVVIAFLMAACGPAGETMDAAVMEEWGPPYWLVAPLPVDPGIHTGTMIALPKSDVPEDLDLQVGDNVRITYRGGILERGPAAFGEVVAVDKIS